MNSLTHIAEDMNKSILDEIHTDRKEFVETLEEEYESDISDLKYINKGEILDLHEEHAKEIENIKNPKSVSEFSRSCAHEYMNNHVEWLSDNLFKHIDSDSIYKVEETYRQKLLHLKEKNTELTTILKLEHAEEVMKLKAQHAEEVRLLKNTLKDVTSTLRTE